MRYENVEGKKKKSSDLKCASYCCDRILVFLKRLKTCESQCEDNECLKLIVIGRLGFKETVAEI